MNIILRNRGSSLIAMGGELDIIARFPQGEVHIKQFEDIEDEKGADVLSLKYQMNMEKVTEALPL